MSAAARAPVVGMQSHLQPLRDESIQVDAPVRLELCRGPSHDAMESAYFLPKPSVRGLIECSALIGQSLLAEICRLSVLGARGRATNFGNQSIADLQCCDAYAKLGCSLGLGKVEEVCQSLHFNFVVKRRRHLSTNTLLVRSQPVVPLLHSPKLQLFSCPLGWDAHDCM